MLIETMTFRLAAGTKEEAFLAADRRVQTEVMPNLAGFMRRTTAKSPRGDWLVMVLWGSEAEADAVAGDVAAHPATAEVEALIDVSTRTLSRYLTLD